MYRVFSGPQGSRQGIFMVFKKNIQKNKSSTFAKQENIKI